MDRSYCLCLLEMYTVAWTAEGFSGGKGLGATAGTSYQGQDFSILVWVHLDGAFFNLDDCIWPWTLRRCRLQGWNSKKCFCASTEYLLQDYGNQITGCTLSMFPSQFPKFSSAVHFTDPTPQASESL